MTVHSAATTTKTWMQFKRSSDNLAFQDVNTLPIQMCDNPAYQEINTLPPENQPHIYERVPL